MSSDEFEAYMVSLGRPIAQDELKQAMEVVFGTTDVDFPAFLAGFLRLQSNTDAVRAGFSLLDKDGSGDISPAELNELFDKSGLLTDEGKKIIFSAVDKDGDQVLNFDEFVVLQQAG